MKKILEYIERKKIQHLVWLGVTFILLVYIASYEQFTLLSIDGITGLFYSFGGYARAAFIIIFLITIPIPQLKPLFFLAAGMSFGLTQGIYLSLLSELAANLVHLQLLVKWHHKTRQKLQHSPYKALAHIKQPFTWIIKQRVFPAVPYDVQQWVISMQPIRELKLVSALILGSIPTILILVFLGNSLFFVGQQVFWIATGIFILFSVTQLIVSIIHHKQYRL